MPVELMLLPSWAYFHLDKVSYWSRTVVVPLLVLAALRPVARNPRGVDIRELFLVPPEREQGYMQPPVRAGRLERFFYGVDRALRALEPLSPRALRARSLAKAMHFFRRRLNGVDGLGAIFPAMANAVMALDAMARRRATPRSRRRRRRSVSSSSSATTKRTANRASRRSGTRPSSCTRCSRRTTSRSARPSPPRNGWLARRQVLDVRGDWAVKAPKLRSGGWAFQYWNDYYPDVDDTAVVAMALHREDPDAYDEPLARASEWVMGMQSRCGGWGAFDIDTTTSN